MTEAENIFAQNKLLLTNYKINDNVLITGTDSQKHFGTVLGFKTTRGGDSQILLRVHMLHIWGMQHDAPNDVWIINPATTGVDVL